MPATEAESLEQLRKGHHCSRGTRSPRPLSVMTIPYLADGLRTSGSSLLVPDGAVAEFHLVVNFRNRLVTSKMLLQRLTASREWAISRR